MITNTQTHRRRRLTDAELARNGVRLISSPEIRLACQGCGRDWSPNLGRDGRLPKGYWLCPGGCNASD